jgi:hypothetical protein
MVMLYIYSTCWCMKSMFYEHQHTPRLKRLFLSEETTKQMRWHKEGKRDSEDSNIMSHPADVEAWQTFDYFDLEFARDPRSVRLFCRWMVLNLTAPIVAPTLAG